MLYQGQDRMLIQGVLILPVSEFLAQLRPQRGLTMGI